MNNSLKYLLKNLEMKKQILIIAMAVFMTIGFNAVMAQNRPDRRPPQEQADTLNVKQTQKINKILTDYDSESLTADDAKSIMKAIRDAKIPGGKGVEKAINAAGFDFEEIRKLAPPPERPKRKDERE